MSEVAPFLGSRAQKGFLGTILLQAVIVLTMLAISLGLVEGNKPANAQSSRTLPCYFALFALAEIFHVFLSVDALRLRNIIQILGLLIFQMGLIIYGAIQISETHDGLVTNPGADCSDPAFYSSCSGKGSLWDLVEPFQIVIPVVFGVSWGLLILFAHTLYQEFGWFVFRVVGADPRLKDMFEYYQIMIVLLKFDFFAFTGLTMQLLILVIKSETAQYALTIAAIPIVMILLIGCGIAVAREIKWLMLISLTLLLASWAYFIYKFTRLFEPADQNLYRTTKKTLGVFIVGAFLLIFATFWVGVKCFLDFDKGLRTSKMKEPTIFTSANFLSNAMDTSKEGKGVPMSPNGMERARASYVGGEPLAPRMSID